MRILGYKLSVTAQIGIAIVIINVLVALFAPLIAPYDQATPVGDAWADPDAQHWLGLDNLGRDILSRLIYGARMSIGLSLVITALSFLHRRHFGLRRRRRRRLDRSGAVAARRSPAVDADAHFRLRHPVGARFRPAGPHHHDRDPRFDQGLSSGAVGRR